MGARIWINPLGNMGNRALQYLAAEGIRHHAPEISVENVLLPEWGISEPAQEPPLKGSVRTGEFRGWLDVAGFADCLQRGVVKSVILDGYCFHLENYPTRDVARRLLGPMLGGEEALGFGEHELVCSIRGNEILSVAHPDYIALPPSYYAQLAERSGLQLVFFGQLEDNAYSSSLHRAFPKARFVQSVTPAFDFEMLRRSQNIALSVSTFSWLAAWLGKPAKVYLPICGMLNPVQSPYQSFLPLDEPEYEYTLFPYSKALNIYTNPVKFMHMQDQLGTYARPVGVEELRDIAQRVATLQMRLPFISGFEEEFYKSRYPDVAEAMESGVRSGLEHYHNLGFIENREIFALDKEFYASTYPDAAMAVSEGRYGNLQHHYQAVGRAWGYQRQRL